jgi:hypothetical protein
MQEEEIGQSWPKASLRLKKREALSETQLKQKKKKKKNSQYNH